MGREYTIGQLARAVEAPTTTLRYYERIGLLEPEARSHGNYRLYGVESLRRLRFIRAAQAIGFTLDDVNSLLGNRSGQAPSCRKVQALIEERLADIDRRMKDLRHVRGVLKAALQTCLDGEPRGSCRVIESLRTSADDTQPAP